MGPNPRRSAWKGFRLVLKNWFFWLPYLTALLGGSVYLRTLYYYEPPPNVGLNFQGAAPLYFRPDLGLHEDLKKIGIKNPRTDVAGMSQFEVFSGIIRNKGSRDADDLEMKVPTHGNLLFYKAAGLLDGDGPEPDYDRIKILAHGNGGVSPHEYVKLAAMRVDDPALFFMLWCQVGSVTEVRFRYREGDATKTERYVRTTDERGQIYFERIVKWGMIASELKSFAKKLAVGFFIVAVVVIITFWKKRPIWTALRGLSKGLTAELKSVHIRLRGHWQSAKAEARIPATKPATPLSVPAQVIPTAPPAPALTKKEQEQQRRQEQKRRKHERRNKRLGRK